MQWEQQSMSKDEVFTNPDARSSDFEFNAEVAAVFDDMLTRSVPFYTKQQQLIREISTTFYQSGSAIFDLGCSTGTTIAGLAKALPEDASFVGYDNSEPMLERARSNFGAEGIQDRVELRFGDFNEVPPEIENASLVTMLWTLQFVRPLGRDRLIKNIYNGMRGGGALIVTEKIMTNDSHMNRFFIDFYYDFKRRNGYSEDEILRKREALENVLVPYRVDENAELFRRNGFKIVETFFQWYNFAGFLCVKEED